MIIEDFVPEHNKMALINLSNMGVKFEESKMS